MSSENTHGTVVLCAALNVEYLAIREQLHGPLSEEHERGTVYEVGVFVGSAGTWRTVLVLADRDNTPAAVQVERAIARYAPQVLLMVGVAGGRRDAELGDVIAATEIYGYEAGMDTDHDFRPRIKTLRSSHRLLQHAGAVARRDQWHQRIDTAPGSRPRAFIKPLAAGAKVVTGTRSTTARFIDDHCGDAQGVEMEGYGVLAAAYANSGVDALVIRGVSDLLAGKDKRTDRTRQPTAARHAAAFAFALLDRLAPEAGGFATGANAQAAPPQQEPKTTYIGAQGANATAHIAAMGSDAHGVVNVDTYSLPAPNPPPPPDTPRNQ